MQITNMYYTASEYNSLKTKYNNTYNKKYLINDFIVSLEIFNDPNVQNYQFNNFKLSALDIIKNVINYQQSSFTSSSDLINKLNKELLDFKNNSKELDNYLFNNIKNYTNLHKNYPNYKFAWVKKIGLAIISFVDLEIGGVLIDRHYGDYLNIWGELVLNLGKKKALKNMLGNIKLLCFLKQCMSQEIVTPTQYTGVPLTGQSR